MTLPIETYRNYPITLDTKRGLFYAGTEGEVQTVEALTLHEVRERLDVYLAKVTQASRKQRDPVPVVLVYNYKGAWKLRKVSVQGVVAGRPYNAVLRVTEGETIDQIEVREDTSYFHPDDPMLAVLKKELALYAEIRKQLDDSERHILSLTKEGTKIKVPGTRSKEDAIDNERLLHEQLSAITPTRE